MNRQASFRAITRRALRVNYVSPSTCVAASDFASGSSEGAEDSIIDFAGVTQTLGPTLTLTFTPGIELEISDYDNETLAHFVPPFLDLTKSYVWTPGANESVFYNGAFLNPAHEEYTVETTFTPVDGDGFIEGQCALCPMTGILKEEFSTTNILLSWNAVPQAGFYRVWRATNADGPFAVVQDFLGDLFYTDVPGTGTFFYYVTAIEPNSGETAPSNTVSGTST